MDPTISYEKFEELALFFYRFSNLRYGQVWFNLLDFLRPDVSYKIRGTVHDPFHSDDVPEMTSRIAATLWQDINAHDFVA
jgi:hypothetical protein